MSDVGRSDAGPDGRAGGGRTDKVRFDHAIAHAFGRQSMHKRMLEADLHSPTAALTGRAGS